jgi:hypothetical protein
MVKGMPCVWGIAELKTEVVDPAPRIIFAAPRRIKATASLIAAILLLDYSGIFIAPADHKNGTPLAPE